MKRLAIFTLLAASMLAGPSSFAQQPATPGQAPAAKSEARKHGCKEMEKHHEHHKHQKHQKHQKHHSTADMPGHAEKHADCHSDSSHKGKAKDEHTHEHAKPKQS